MENVQRKLNHKGSVELKTERLLLRKIREDDIQEFHNKLASDKKVIEFLNWEETPTIETTTKMVNEILEEYENDISTYKWIIESLDSHEIIGMILVHSFNSQKLFAELDYCIAEEYRGHGYAPEALRKVIEYLIFEVGFFRVEAVYNMNNEASGRVMQKAGMKYEGTLRGRAINLNKDGNPDDLKMCAIIKTDINYV